ncbi:MAG: hydantoinase/carbamoylase family amidase [Spirochaetes bacterium]|jgi:hydantoinase/carbamoylase family amidase|nr:hydantoinase/carbamoylase family amidase [Spirochaetota bacterium]
MTEHGSADPISASQISAERIAADIEAIAGFSESPAEIGYSRPTFTSAWKAARDYVIEQAEKAGAEHVIDAAGNVHVRHPTVGWDSPVWLSGSHLDSVPSGGKYDGVMGVVIPLEILRVRPDLPLELVIFCEEEGTTFNLGMIGSRAWTGAVDVETLERLTNRDGQTVVEAGTPYGLDVERLRAAAAADPASAPTGVRWTDRIDPQRYIGLVEVHAEQGVSLWDAGVPLAAVDRINGRRQFEVTVTGHANHAGSTGMQGRRDALVGAAEMVAAIETLGLELDADLPYSVCTVGRLSVAPGAANVIPGEVGFSVDMRGQQEELLERGETALRERLAGIAGRRGLDVHVGRSEHIAPSPLSSKIGRALQAAAAELGLEIPIRPSGALHDAAIVAEHVPTAMVFVASRGGISHNPEEFSASDDIAQAAAVLLRMIERIPTGRRADSRPEMRSPSESSTRCPTTGRLTAAADSSSGLRGSSSRHFAGGPFGRSRHSTARACVSSKRPVRTRNLPLFGRIRTSSGASRNRGVWVRSPPVSRQPPVLPSSGPRKRRPLTASTPRTTSGSDFHS